MVDYIKNLIGFKKKDDEKEIPQIHLQKKEPKYYYNKDLKKWVIEGQENEVKEEIKPPPKFDGAKKKDGKKAKHGSSRYVSVLGKENIYGMGLFINSRIF